MTPTKVAGKTSKGNLRSRKLWRVGELGSVPDIDDGHGAPIGFDDVKESVGLDDHLTQRKARRSALSRSILCWSHDDRMPKYPAASVAPTAMICQSQSSIGLALIAKHHANQPARSLPSKANSTRERCHLGK